MNFKPDTVGELVQKFVSLRDALAKADENHKTKTAGARETLKSLEAELLDRLNTLQGNSVQTPWGTAYRSEKKSATIADGEAFRTFVIDSKEWDLVDIRANANGVADFLASREALPPGINYSVRHTVGVRRPTNK